MSARFRAPWLYRLPGTRAMTFRFASLTAVLLLVGLASGAQGATDKDKKEGPAINAPHAMLIEARQGGVLFERDPDKLIFPASLSKLMTAEYVFHLLKEGKKDNG